LKPHLRPGLKVLEIGCGYGSLLAELRDNYQADITGVEPDPIARRVAEAAYGIRIRHSSVDRFWEEADSYDVILMHHVLEHLLNPGEVIAQVSRHLKKDGFLYVGVPNVTAMTFPKQLFFRFAHVSNFSPFSLFLLLWQNGWKVIRCDSFKRPLAVIAVLHNSKNIPVSWVEAAKRSLPFARVRRSVIKAHFFHVFRLFIKNHIRPFFPRVLKDFVKRRILNKV